MFIVYKKRKKILNVKDTPRWEDRGVNVSRKWKPKPSRFGGKVDFRPKVVKKEKGYYVLLQK